MQDSPKLSRRPLKAREMQRKGKRIIQLMGWVSRLSWSWLQIIGSFYGACLSVFSTQPRQVTGINLGLCFPHYSISQRRSLKRKSLKYTAQVGLEMIWIWLRDPAEVLRLIKSVNGLALFEDALAKTKGGVVLLCPHLGNWELLNIWLTSRGPLTAMYRPVKYPSVDEVVRKARARLNSTLVPTNRQGVAVLLRTLRQGGLVGILPDQEPDPKGGIYAPFFGQSALTATLSVKLIRQTNSMALCAFAHRLPCGGYHINFQLPDASVYSANLNEACQGLNSSVERCIAVCPEQYQWSYKRFKSSHNGVSPYASLRSKSQP